MYSDKKNITKVVWYLHVRLQALFQTQVRMPKDVAALNIIEHKFHLSRWRFQHRFWVVKFVQKSSLVHCSIGILRWEVKKDPSTRIAHFLYGFGNKKSSRFTPKKPSHWGVFIHHLMWPYSSIHTSPPKKKGREPLNRQLTIVPTQLETGTQINISKKTCLTMSNQPPKPSQASPGFLGEKHLPQPTLTV